MSAHLVLADRDIRVEAGLPRTLRVGLLGCGVVGSAVARALLEDGHELARACGMRLELARVAVRDPEKMRTVTLPHRLFTTDALAVAIDPEIDIVVEVIGGTHPAMQAIQGGLADNKIVVTANKELLAGAGADLVDGTKRDFYFEASVCGAIPIVRALREYCAGDRIHCFTGIFSGTCNYVLSQMTQSGCSLPAALASARQLGYAETDATADVEAWDAAAKVAILASVAFGVRATADQVERKGILDLDPPKIYQAAAEGLVWKLIGSGRRKDGRLDLSVTPQLLAFDDPLAQVEGAQNAVLVTTERAGQLTFQGIGAGGKPTAAAILGDLIAAVRSRFTAKQLPVCIG